jgi:protease PrsW
MLNTISLILLSILPGLLISWYVVSRDKYEPEPKLWLVISFMFGAMSTVPAIFLERALFNWFGIGISDNIIGTFICAFFGIALVEEGLKYLFLKKFVYPADVLSEPMDGIVYAVMISMGFATWENIVYLLIRDTGSIEVALLRMFTAIPAHAAFAIIMGFHVGLAKFVPANRNSLLMRGLFWAVVAHGGYDFFIFQTNYIWMKWMALACLSISIFVAFILMGIMEQDAYERHHQEFEIDPDAT